MTELYVRIHLWLAGRRRAVLFLMALLLVAGALSGLRLKLNEDFTDMLPMSAPAIAEQVQAMQRVNQTDRVYIDVSVRQNNQEVLTDAADRMETALRDIPELRDVLARIDADAFEQVYQRLQEQLPTLLTRDELQQLRKKLEPAALEERLRWLKTRMSQPQGMMLKRVARQDPAGLSDSLTAKLRDLQAGIGNARIIDGRIASADGRHILLTATTGFPSSDTGRSAAMVESVLQAARTVEAAFPGGSVAVTSAHRSALDNARTIEADSLRTGSMAMVAVLILMAAVFRRRWLAALGAAPTIVGILGALTLLSLGGAPVSAVALGCGSILTGVTIDYGICLLYHSDNSPAADREGLARIISLFVPEVTVGALTTMAAFLVMFLSPVPGHRQLALFGSLGVALAALFALIVLPLTIPVQQRNSGTPLPLTTVMSRLLAWRARNTSWLGPALALFTIVCAVGAFRLEFGGDIERLNGVSEATARDEAIVRETWGHALSLSTIVVSGATEEEALQKNEAVHAALLKLRAAGAIESVSSAAPLMPSLERRRENLRAWREFWADGNEGSLRAGLAGAAAGLGFRKAAFEPFLQRLGGAEFNANDLVGLPSPLGDLAEEYRMRKDGGIHIASLAKTRDLAGFRALRAAVKAAVPDARLLNKAAMAAELTSVARDGLARFAGWVMILHAIILLALLGRIELVAIAMSPMLIGVFWTLGTFGLLGLPIDISNFIFVIFVIGVGGDYSLFMILAELDRLRGHEDRIAGAGGAVTVCALTTLIGVGSLALADHPALFSIGMTALLGISFSLVATLAVIPAAMQWIARRARMPARVDASPDGPADRRRIRQEVVRLYRYHTPYVTQFAWWKTKIDPLYPAVEKAAPKAGEILDLGCGFGITLHWLTLASPDRRGRGIDFDAFKVRVASTTAETNPKVNFEQQDLLEWTDYPACDCILLCDVLHYFPHAHKAAILRQAFRALRPGGTLIIRDALADRSKRHRKTALSERWAVRIRQNISIQGLHFEDKEAHLKLLRETGYENVAVADNSGLGSNFMITALKRPGLPG